MSYCRNNGEDSDVYVIRTNGGLQCCGCRLYGGVKFPMFDTQVEMIKHLVEHLAVHDKVPMRAIERLEREAWLLDGGHGVL